MIAFYRKFVGIIKNRREGNLVLQRKTGDGITVEFQFDDLSQQKMPW